MKTIVPDMSLEKHRKARVEKAYLSKGSFHQFKFLTSSPSRTQTLYAQSATLQQRVLCFVPVAMSHAGNASNCIWCTNVSAFTVKRRSNQLKQRRRSRCHQPHRRLLPRDRTLTRTAAYTLRKTKSQMK